MITPHVKSFFDEDTFTVSYVISDETSRKAAIIDSVLDYDPASGRTSTASADEIIAYVRAEALTVDYILETHVHADHLSAAQYLRETLGGKTVIGSAIGVIQTTFAPVFNAEDEFIPDGRQFDIQLADGDTLTLGDLTIEAMHTPGHTPACMTYVVGDAAFVGDTLFMPDYGTARCDFPGGDAEALYESIHRIFALPANTRLFMCHDYKAPERDEFAWETTVAEEKNTNVHIGHGITKEAFVRMRTERDKYLAMPKLILPSVQVNMRAGAFPPAEENGIRYLKIPLDTV